MKLLCQLCLLICFSSIQAFTQTMTEAFQMTSAISGSEAEYKPIVESARDGGFIIGLRIKAPKGVRDPILDGIKELGRDFDVMVFKLKEGNVEWAYQSSRIVSEVIDLAVDSAGNVLLLASTFSWPDPSKGNYGLENLAVVKISPQGDQIWEKIFGGSQRDVAKSIAVGADNRVFVAAVSGSKDYDVPTNKGNFDWWILTLSENGDLMRSQVMGGSQTEWPGGVIATPDGGCVVAGFSLSNDQDFDTNMAGYDAWAVRFDPDGEVKWQTRLGSSGRDEFVNGREYGGNFYLLGFCNYWDGNIDTSTWKGGGDYWLVKLSGSGEVLSQKFYGSTMGEWPVDIAMIPEGPQFVIAGETSFRVGDGNRWDISEPRVETDSWGVSGDWWILVVDTNLAAVDDFIYGGSYREYCRSVAANRSSFLVCGSTASNNGNVKDYKGNHPRYQPPDNLWIVEISTGVASVQMMTDSRIEHCVDIRRDYSNALLEVASLCGGNDIESIEIFNLAGKKVPAQISGDRGQGYRKVQVHYHSEVVASLFVVVKMTDGKVLYKVL